MSEYSKEYCVEKILRRKVGHKFDKTGIYYLMKWQNYDDSWNTWEPEQNLNCDQILEEFVASKVYEIESKFNQSGFL